MTSHFLSYAWGNAHDSDFCQTYRSPRPGGISTDRVNLSIEIIRQLTGIHFSCSLDIVVFTGSRLSVLQMRVKKFSTTDLTCPLAPQASGPLFSLQNGQVWLRCLWRISGSQAFEHWRLRKNILVIVSHVEACFTDQTESILCNRE